MQRRPSKLVTATAAVIMAVPVVAGCEAKVYGTPPELRRPAADRRRPAGHARPRCRKPHPTSRRRLRRPGARAKQATAEAAKAGADITSTVLDRNTGQIVSNGNDAGDRPSPRWSSCSSPTTCCCRRRRARPSCPPTTARRSTPCCGPPTTARPRSSGTAAAAARSSTGSPPGTGWVRPRRRYNGRWFNTMSTTADLVRYYDMLLAGSGGLPPEQASIILSNLAASTPTAIDGMSPAAYTRSGSASPRGCTRNPLRSNRAGCAAGSAATGCTCPPA